MRPTVDIDILDSWGTDLRTIAKLVGRNSPLHNKHGVYIDVGHRSRCPDNTAFDEAFEKLSKSFATPASRKTPATDVSM